MDGPNRQAKVPLLCRSTGENEGESIISGNGTSVASHHKRINIARPQQATQLWLSLDENEFDTLMDEIELSCGQQCVGCHSQRGYGLARFILDTHGCPRKPDVYVAFIIDTRVLRRWHLRSRLHTGFTLCLPSWKAKEPAEMADRDDPRLHIIAKLIAVQLLGSSFTSPHNMNTSTLPANWYHKGYQVDSYVKNTGLVSSLRQHTQFRHEPAYGHHARNNSAVWPDKERVPSREDYLAGQISRKRLSRREEGGAIKKESVCKRGCRATRSNTRHSFLSLRHHHCIERNQWSSSSRESNIDRRNAEHTKLDPNDSIRWTNTLRVMRGLRQRDYGNDGHRWSFEPALHSESHLLFIQPVKDCVLKRWRVFRYRTRSETNCESSDGEREGLESGRRASKDFIQFNRDTPILTMFQGSEGSSNILPVDPDGGVSSSVAAEAFPAQAITEYTLKDRMLNLPTDEKETMSLCMLDSPMQTNPETHEDDGTSHFSLAQRSHDPRETSAAPVERETRERAPTRGTTVHNQQSTSEIRPNTTQLRAEEDDLFSGSSRSRPTLL